MVQNNRILGVFSSAKCTRSFCEFIDFKENQTLLHDRGVASQAVVQARDKSESMLLSISYSTRSERIWKSKLRLSTPCSNRLFLSCLAQQLADFDLQSADKIASSLHFASIIHNCANLFACRSPACTVLSNLSFDCSREKMTKDDYRILQYITGAKRWTTYFW